MISTTTVRERPQLLPHSHTDPNITRHFKHSPTSSWPDKLKVTTVDISLLLKPRDDEAPISANSSGKASPSAGSLTAVGSPAPPTQSTSPSTTNTTITSTSSTAHSRAPLASLTHGGMNLHSSSTIPAKRNCRNFDQPAIESPAKKQSKWSPEEDAKIIQLRGDGMKWEDISKHLPGRSAISCRLHYQNYLERRSEWDEDRKNKLARLYERFKSDMWSRIAEEMAIPWRAAEAMHWQMGEQEMARRAGVTPFSLTTNLNIQQQQQQQQHHHHSHSANPGLSQHPRPVLHVRSNSATTRMRRDSQPMPGPYGCSPAAPLPPPPTPSGPSTLLIPPQLPSLAELTAGLPAYSPGNISVQLTPHPYNSPTSNAMAAHHNRFHPVASPHHPIPTASAVHAQTSRL